MTLSLRLTMPCNLKGYWPWCETDWVNGEKFKKTDRQQTVENRGSASGRMDDGAAKSDYDRPSTNVINFFSVNYTEQISQSGFP